MDTEKIGFIGQGWIGKHYADDFENRGYEVVRYALESEYRDNKPQLADCTIIFIAVPTPTTPAGFDVSAVESALTLVPTGAIAVIKSTLAVNSTNQLQRKFPDCLVLHSPEFLVENTAAYDAAHPNRNIIGIPEDTSAYQAAAARVLAVLPKASYQIVLAARDAELVKYAGNCFLYSKVVFMNLLYDLVTQSGGDWDGIREALVHDPRIGESHTQPISSSRDGSKIGRGAGGHCFVKDFETFKAMYSNHVGDAAGIELLESMSNKNKQLLVESGKDLEIVAEVFGRAEQSKEEK